MRDKLPKLLFSFGLLGWCISGADPFWVNSWFGLVPALFLFGAFSYAVLAWGAIAEKRLGGGGAGVFLYSSVAAVAYAFLLGHLGLLGAPGKWLFLFFLVAGLWLSPPLNPRALLPSGFSSGQCGVVLFVFLLRTISAFQPQAHGDPLLYHLMAPRLWNLHGSVGLNHDLPIPLLAASWEYFYLWPQVLFANPGTRLNDLIFAQILCQWIHLWWGLFGAMLVFSSLWERLPEHPLRMRAKFPALLSLLFVSSMQWTAPLAKNDCGAAFWALGAWLFLQHARAEHRTWRHWALAGLFTGLAITGKINSIFFLIPVVLLFATDLFLRVARRELAPELMAKVSGAFVVGAAAGALPIYLRNFFETGNPFYTMFSHWFPSYWVSQSWANHFSAHQPKETDFLSMLLIRAHQLSKESPAYWLLLLGAVALVISRVRRSLAPYRLWFVAFWLSLLLLLVAVDDAAEVRYLGAGLWLGAILGTVIFLSMVDTLIPRATRLAAGFLVIALLATSKLPTHILWKLPKIATGEAAVLQHTAGTAKAWLRANVPAGKLVVIHLDNETYYLSGLRVTVLTERPDIDAATYGVNDLPTFVRGLCRTSKAAFLLDAREHNNLLSRFKGGPWSQVTLFSDGGARVYDLTMLERNVLGPSSAGDCGKE